MEKLIKAINKYGKTGNCGPFETCRIEPATNYNSSYLVLSWDDNGEGDWKSWHLEVPRLISKEYGFIQRLVEQDKIDESKINLNDYEIEIRIRAVKELLSDSEEKTVLYLQLLMLLSISEQPIELLCSILK